MEHTKEPGIDEARTIAAQCWCTETTSHIEMDVELAEVFAKRIAAWMATGSQHATNESYWRDRALSAEQQRDELQLERDNYKSVAEAHSGAFQECIRLREKRDELLAALKRLWLSCPTGLECNSFHHAKRDQHDFNQECGPAAEYLAAIEQANATIAKVQK